MTKSDVLNYIRRHYQEFHCQYNVEKREIQETKTTKEYILNFLKQNRLTLEDKFGVTKIGLFGSYARNEATLNSDIDIAVEIESRNSFRSFFSLLHFLEDGLNSKIDLGIESSIKPIAKTTILKDIIYV